MQPTSEMPTTDSFSPFSMHFNAWYANRLAEKRRAANIGNAHRHFHRKCHGLLVASHARMHAMHSRVRILRASEDCPAAKMKASEGSSPKRRPDQSLRGNINNNWGHEKASSSPVRFLERYPPTVFSPIWVHSCFFENGTRLVLVKIRSVCSILLY